MMVMKGSGHCWRRDSLTSWSMITWPNACVKYLLFKPKKESQWLSGQAECRNPSQSVVAKSVKYPAEARGWITLNCSGLSSDQQAIVVAKTGANLKFETAVSSMRPCFPDYVASTKAKKWNAAFLADPPHGFHEDEFHHAKPGDSIVFEEVEAFLSEYGVQAEDFTGEFDEAESAEILAANWKDRRNEIARLQKTQNFKQVSKIQHQFKENLSEVKERIRCRKCNKLGHWARECTMAKGKGKSSASSSDWSGQANGAALVEGQPLNEPWCCLNIRWFLALVLVLSILAVARRWLVKQHSMSCSGCMRKEDRAAMPSQTERFVCLWKQQRRVGRPPCCSVVPPWRTLEPHWILVRALYPWTEVSHKSCKSTVQVNSWSTSWTSLRVKHWCVSNLMPTKLLLRASDLPKQLRSWPEVSNSWPSLRPDV